jgi:hypothetical protein
MRPGCATGAAGLTAMPAAAMACAAAIPAGVTAPVLCVHVALGKKRE